MAAKLIENNYLKKRYERAWELEDKVQNKRDNNNIIYEKNFVTRALQNTNKKIIQIIQVRGDTCFTGTSRESRKTAARVFIDSVEAVGIVKTRWTDAVVNNCNNIIKWHSSGKLIPLFIF